MTHSLRTVLEHAQRQRDETLAALLAAEEAVRRLRLQSEQLHAYRDEYQARGPGQGGRSTTIELLRCHQAFMQRLEQALAQQRTQLALAQEHSAQLRTTLLARETRVASVRKLLERRQQDQLRSGARQEQRRSDDAAVQRLWHEHAFATGAAH